MNADEVVQALEVIEDLTIQLVSDGWYTKERLLEQIENAIDEGE